MATAITPTLTAQRWGPETWQLFDYKAHPIRDPGGNPCLVFFHGGGHMVGNYHDIWIVNGLAVQPYNNLLNFLLDPARGTHFDIISLETAQYRHTDVGGGNGTNPGFAMSKQMFFWTDGLNDAKRGIAAMKAWGVGFNNTSAFRLNPDLFISGGGSAGAVKAALAQITKPLDFRTRQKTFTNRINEPGTFDSSVNGILWIAGQIDFRKKIYNGQGPVDYQPGVNNKGYFGTRDDDAGVEWDALPEFYKSAISLVAYLENRDTQYWKPLFNVQIEQGDHLLPITNGHDSRQLRDLNVAMDGAGVKYDSLPPISGPEGSIIQNTHAQRIYGFMVQCLKDANPTSPLAL